MSAEADSPFLDYPTRIMNVGELTPWPRNYLFHPTEQVDELGESLDTFLQYKPVVVWQCRENFTFEDGAQLHDGVWYLVCGHGLWAASMKVGRDRLEVKDISGVSVEVAEAILVADNAAPLGGQPDRDKLAAILARTRDLEAQKPRLAAMLGRLRQTNWLQLSGGGNPDSVNDPYEEWQGMPEFENNPKAQRTLYIHFEDNKSVEEFADLIGQIITDKTKSLWYPYKPDNIHMNKDLIYKNES